MQQQRLTQPLFSQSIHEVLSNDCGCFMSKTRIIFEYSICQIELKNNN
jgi:hypothetical protein